MSKKFKVWLDSGANCQSCYEQEILLSDIGIEDEDWEKMTEEEKDEAMRDVAFERSEWGYSEV
ncbi:MAG: DUF7167 family protein [Aeromonadaceae bacterium]